MDPTRTLAEVTFSGVRGRPLEWSEDLVDRIRTVVLIALSAEQVGAAAAIVEQTVEYTKSRKQFGRAIGSFQAYKHRLADMVVEVEQARSAVYWAACACDEGADEAAIALHSAKSFAADTAFMCAGNMIQLHGGIGFTWEHDAHLFFKRARALQSMLGSGEWHREQVATMILGEAA